MEFEFDVIQTLPLKDARNFNDAIEIINIYFEFWELKNYSDNMCVSYNVFREVVYDWRCGLELVHSPPSESVKNLYNLNTVTINLFRSLINGRFIHCSGRNRGSIFKYFNQQHNLIPQHEGYHPSVKSQVALYNENKVEISNFLLKNKIYGYNIEYKSSFGSEDIVVTANTLINFNL